MIGVAASASPREESSRRVRFSGYVRGSSVGHVTHETRNKEGLLFLRGLIGARRKQPPISTAIEVPPLG